MPAATFQVQRQTDGPVAFVVVDPAGQPVPVIHAFLTRLAVAGRSPYTLRAYAFGLADFFSWLHRTATPLEAVTRQTIGTYIAAFAQGPKGGACPVAPDRPEQIDPLTRQSSPAPQRQPRTINHRLSVLAAFFADRGALTPAMGESGAAPTSPVPGPSGRRTGQHGMVGRDAPSRGRAGEFRRRVPYRVPQPLDPSVVTRLIAAATSDRDKALLMLLARTGQRIGDWSSVAGRHGLLGLSLADLDPRRQTLTVRLKGARDAHMVPVADDCWPLLQRYLQHERGPDLATPALWVGRRRGQGQPLTYAAFESALRALARRLGLRVHAHLFRHTLAQALVDLGHLKVAQEVLGHRHLSTTADQYARVDQAAMVEALRAAAVRLTITPDPAATSHLAATRAADHPPATIQYVFPYAPSTLAELDPAAGPAPGAPSPYQPAPTMTGSSSSRPETPDTSPARGHDGAPEG